MSGQGILLTGTKAGKGLLRTGGGLALVDPDGEACCGAEVTPVCDICIPDGFGDTITAVVTGVTLDCCLGGYTKLIFTGDPVNTTHTLTLLHHGLDYCQWREDLGTVTVRNYYGSNCTGGYYDYTNTLVAIYSVTPTGRTFRIGDVAGISVFTRDEGYADRCSVAGMTNSLSCGGSVTFS